MAASSGIGDNQALVANSVQHVEVIQTWLSRQECVLSRLELQSFQNEIDVLIV